MEPSPISASLGAMGSLPGKLDELLATRHWALRGVVMDEIEQLTTDLRTLHNFLVKLSNAQDPPMTARYWMKNVRELSYDMVDCADQFVHVDDRAKIHRSTRRKVITRLKINRLPERWKWRPWITNKVSEFRTRAQEATQQYWRYNFDDCPCNPGYSRIGRELPTVLPDPDDLVGMEGPMNQLDRWLTNGEEKLKVVSIVGVGGIGKTTLAQKLWGKLHGQFECGAFVRTAQKPDMRGVIRSILSQVRRHQPPDPGEMHHLIRDLREYLQDKRYFVIIDDLWATSVWDVFSRAFPEGNCCSRIITTTEIMEVALACCGYCPEHIFEMESLSDDDSEKLLLQRILVSGNQQLDNVLPQIMRNCGGLPLAIIIVASLLACQPEKLEQLGCMQDSFGANHTMKGFMGQILNISFNSLPHYLKTCLLHLSTYPEGFLFLKGDLVKQWVAEGFICAKEGEDIEEVAGSYFDELVSTGLIQAMDINCNYEVLSYSVHHMVLDLITYKSMEANFITVVDYSQTTIPLADKVRRLSLHFGSATCATTPASTTLSQVRSLFFSGLFNCVPSFMVFKLLQVLVLHLWGDIENTSFNLEGICELFRLRYLQVTCNVPVKLPDQIEPMKQLETLELNVGVCAVPPDIVRLSNLLHLRLRSGANLPDGVGCMRSLRTLMCFDLGNSSEDNLWGLGELTNLRDLHLTYSSSPSIEHLKKNLIALATSLGKLCNLKSFTLASGASGTVVLFVSSSSMYSTPFFLESLELLPPICVFSRFPKWIGQLHKLCILKIAVRELLMSDIDSLTGLHSLKVLSLCVQEAPERRIVFNDGAFPVLKYFKFRCGVLYMSFMAGAMPNLRRLKLRFNTHIGENYDNMLAGVDHLLNLQDIAGRIGARTESDRKASESAFKDTISKHPMCPRFNVKWVDPVEEEYHPSEKQHRRQEKGLSVEKHGILEKAEDTNKHADDGLSQNSALPSTCCHQVKRCIEIGLRCMDHALANRSTTQHIIHSLEKTDVTERSVRSDLDSSYLKQMILPSKAAFRPAVAESKTLPATVVAESKASPTPTPINTTPHRSLTKPKQNISANDPHPLTLCPRPASPSLAKNPMAFSPATLRATDCQGSSFHSPFSSFGRLLRSRRDMPVSAAMLASGGEADLEAFQRHVAVSLAELRDREGFLSVTWIRRLLEAFLQCQEEFRVVVAHVVQCRAGGWERAERLVVEYYQRVVNALDVCNAASEGVDKARRWGRLASIAASVLLAPGKIHEGQLRRARKALSDLSVLLVDEDAAAGGTGVIASHRNRSFRPSTRMSPSHPSSVSSSKSAAHFRSLSWSVPCTWSAARQLQAIGLGLAVPHAHEAGLAAPVYAMVCVLHLVSWVLVAAVPYPNRGAALQADHLPAAPLRAAFSWVPPLLALQERLSEEGKRKDRLNSCGLLKEIHALEKCAQRLADTIDSAPILLASVREATVREAAAELAAVCAAMKDGLEPLERQVREVYHHIARYRMEGLDSFMLNAATKDRLEPLERQALEVVHHKVRCRMEGLDSLMLNAD